MGFKVTLNFEPKIKGNSIPQSCSEAREWVDGRGRGGRTISLNPKQHIPTFQKQYERN